MISLKILPKAPFDFSLSVKQIEGWPRTYYFAWTGTTLFQSVSLDSFSTVFSLTWNGSIDHPELALDLPDGLSKSQVAEVEKTIRRQFSTDYELGRIFTEVPDKKLQELVSRRKGFHPVIFPSPWECIAFSIISSQVSARLATRIVENLMEKYGTRLDWQNMDFLCFPRPDEFARATAQDLRDLSLSRQKIDYLGGLSGRLAKGELRFSDWETLDDDRLIDSLLSIKGVGRYTAMFTVPFGFGRMEAIVPVEGGFRKVLAEVYGVDGFTDEDYQAILDSWGRFREIALFFVWTEYDDRKRAQKKK